MRQVSEDKVKTQFDSGRQGVCIWLTVSLFFFAGCSIGPSMMRANHLTYNDAVQLTGRQELLLNIVRLRYNEGPEFLTTSSISTQFSFDLSASAGGLLGDDQRERTELFNFDGGIGYSEQPTVTFTPRNEKEFTRELISPIELEIIYLLINYGWDIDRVLRLTTNSINGLRNDTIREDPTEDYVRHLREFSNAVKKMAKLQNLGLIEMSFEQETIGLSGPINADKVNLNEILMANEENLQLKYHEQTDTYRLMRIDQNLVLRFSRDAMRLPELHQIVKSLKLDPNVQSYRLVNAPGAIIKTDEGIHNSTDCILSTRSVLAAMAYLAQGVSVPAKHVSEGVVLEDLGMTVSEGSIRDLLQVRVQSEKPKRAILAIPYRGYWFYIRDNDISSRRTLGVLNSLVRLKIQASASQGMPVLTLPVGR